MQGFFNEENCGKEAFSCTEQAVCCGSFCTHIPSEIRIEFREMGSCCAGQKRNDFIRGRCARVQEMCCCRCSDLSIAWCSAALRVPEGLGVYRLVNSVYLVLNAGCLSGVTTACSRLSAACEARGENHRLGAVLRLAFRAFFALSAACAAVVLLCGGSIAANLLGDGRCARAFPYMLLCLTLTGVENIFKSLFIGLERVQYTACSEVGEQLIRIFAVSFLLYEYGSGDYGRIAMLIFAGMVCSEVFSALFLTRLFRRNMRHIRFTRPDTELYGQFFGIAAPLSVSALIGNMLGSAGAVLLPQRLMAAGLDYEQALSALGVISGMAMPRCCCFRSRSSARSARRCCPPSRQRRQSVSRHACVF